MANESGTPILLDSSVLIKWFLEEEDSYQALWLKAAINKGRILTAITELSFYEIANGLRWSSIDKPREVNRAIQALQDEGLPTIAFDSNVLHVAIEIAMQAGITVYDAYFVAQADLEGLRLITADKKLARAVRGLTDVMTLEEYTAKLN